MKAFFDKIKENEFYQMWFKKALPYVTGAVLLSLFQVVTFATTGNPWGVSGVMANWGAWIFEALGGSVDRWYYFSSPGAQATLEGGILNDPASWRNLGIIFGALFAALMASGFKFKKIKSVKQVVAATVGMLMITARLAADTTSARSFRYRVAFAVGIGLRTYSCSPGSGWQQAAREAM